MTVAGSHDEIRMVIPGIVSCLRDSAWRVRQATINGLSKLAVHRMYNHLFRLRFLLMLVAEFHEEIRTATPSIMECLEDSSWKVREAAITGFSSFAALRMCYHLLLIGVLSHGCS